MNLWPRSEASRTNVRTISQPRTLSANIPAARRGLFTKSGLEIATDTVANASTTFNLATKNSSLVATLATMFL